MKAHLIDTHLQVPRSRSSTKVKVKYQGHVSQKMGVSGALVFHKHILFCIKVCSLQYIYSCLCLFQPKLYTCELLDLVSSHYKLREKEYFGLAFLDDT